MADELNENLPDLPADELKKQIEGEKEPQAEISEAKTEDKPAPATEGQAEEKKVEEPKLILDKFKTQDDLVKGYQNVEKRSTKAEQLLAQYKEIMSPYVEFDENGNVVNIRTTPTVPTTPQGQAQTDVLAMLEERYNRYTEMYGATRANIMLQAEIAQAVAQEQAAPITDLKASRDVELQKTKLRGSKTDFSQYEGEIDKYLERMDAKSKSNPNAVETLYYMVKGKNVENLLKAKEEEAQLKTVEIEKQKEKAQVEHQTKTPEQPKSDIESLSSKELAAQFGLKRIDR